MKRIAILSCIIATGPAWADWREFRGPGHQGHSDEKGLPVRWGPMENIRWKVKLPGPGTSSPIIVGDRLFITCFTGEKATNLVRHLMCFDRASGKLLWEEKRSAPQPENDHVKQLREHGFSTGTPISDGERLYVNFHRGGVFCFSLDGKEVWSKELGKYLNSFGSGSSPSLYGNLLLVNASVESGFLYALNKMTGETVWRAKIPGDCWTTPVTVTTAGGKQEVVLNGPEELYGFDTDKGQRLWSCKTIGGYVSSTPVVSKDILYVPGVFSGERMVMAVRAGGMGDVTETRVLWKNNKVGASFCSPVLVGDRLYFFSGQGYCLNAKTGEVITQKRLEGVTNLYGSPIYADGKIYLFTRNAGAHVLLADEKLIEVANNDLGDKSNINASPAASHGCIFIRSNTHLYCIGNK